MNSKKIEEAIRTLLEETGVTGEEEIEDVEVISFGVKASDTARGNNPCGHEGQANCPGRCKQDSFKPGRIYHCHVNNCGTGDFSARCNRVVDLNC